MKETEGFARQFRELQPKFSKFFVGILTEARLTFPQYALLNLLESRGTIPMTEASAELHVTKPAVTNLVDRLEKAKCLKRVRHPSDRRVSLLEIQPKGRKIVHSARSHLLTLLLKTLGGFNEKEKRIVVRFYSSLSKNFDDVLAGERRGKR